MYLAEVLLFSHPMPVGRVLVSWFLSHPMPVRIWVVCTLLSFMFHRSRRIMGVFWSAGDWFRQQHLFPWSSFSFESVWLVRQRYISPGLSLARGERESEHPSSPHFCPLSAFRDRTFVLSIFSAFVRHEHFLPTRAQNKLWCRSTKKTQQYLRLVAP